MQYYPADLHILPVTMTDDICFSADAQVAARFSGVSPLPLSMHSVCSSSSGDVLYTFGGWNGSDLVNSFHMLSLNTNQWTFLNPQATGTRPSARCSAAMCFSHISEFRSDFVFIFGGTSSSSQILDDFFIYNVFSKEWRLVSSASSWPSGLMFPSCCVLADRYFVLCGIENGFESMKSVVLWMWDALENSWSLISRKDTEAKCAHLVRLDNSSCLVVLGNLRVELLKIVPKSSHVKSTSAFSGHSFALHSVSVSPDIRISKSKFGTALLSANPCRVLIQGGWNGEQFLDDMHVLSLPSTQPNGSLPLVATLTSTLCKCGPVKSSDRYGTCLMRADHGMLSLRNEIYLIGGRSGALGRVSKDIVRVISGSFGNHDQSKDAQDARLGSQVPLLPVDSSASALLNKNKRTPLFLVNRVTEDSVDAMYDEIKKIVAEKSRNSKPVFVMSPSEHARQAVTVESSGAALLQRRRSSRRKVVEDLASCAGDLLGVLFPTGFEYSQAISLATTASRPSSRPGSAACRNGTRPHTAGSTRSPVDTRQFVRPASGRPLSRPQTAGMSRSTADRQIIEGAGSPARTVVRPASAVSSNSVKRPSSAVSAVSSPYSRPSSAYVPMSSTAASRRELTSTVEMMRLSIRRKQEDFSGRVQTGGALLASRRSASILSSSANPADEDDECGIVDDGDDEVDSSVVAGGHGLESAGLSRKEKARLKKQNEEMRKNWKNAQGMGLSDDAIHGLMHESIEDMVQGLNHIGSQKAIRSPV
eukprot:ANDGO_04984.mRNA.1 muskelin 1